MLWSERMHMPRRSPARTRRATTPATSFAVPILLATLFSCGYAPLERRPDLELYEFSMRVDAPEAIGAGEVMLWIPVPLAGDYQECSRLHPVVRGGEARESYDALGNRILHVKGRAPLSVDYSLRVRRFAANPPRRSKESGGFAPNSPWLASTERAPLDAIRRTALFETSRATTTLERARILFDHAVDRLKLAEDPSHLSKGSLAHILARGVHDSFDRSIWLSSALRSLAIPSYLEHGWRLGALSGPGALDEIEATDADSWLRFEVPSMGFLPADPTRAYEDAVARRQHFGGLDATRIRISRGRDITLVPPQRGPKLARFVRPYAELDGVDVSAGLRVRIQVRRPDARDASSGN